MLVSPFGTWNLGFSIYKPQLSDNKSHAISHFEIAPNIAPIITTFALKRLIMGEQIYPFRKASLQDCKGNIKKRWYISFYVWDTQKNDIVRKREYSINQYKTKEERYAFAKQRVESINTLLAEGFHIDSRKNDEVFEELKNVTTLEDALKKILEIKKQSLREKSYGTYYYTLQDFLAWAKKNRLDKTDINCFDRYHAQSYVDYLIIERELTGKSINNNVAFMKSLFNGLKEREVIVNSPMEKLKKQKEIKTFQNLAYTKQEINNLKNLIKEEDPKLWVFIQLIFYCFLRPGEIRFLKKENINLSSGKIFIPAIISKNAKNDHVDIPEPLKPVLEEYLKTIPDKEYIFPGTRQGMPMGECYMRLVHKNFLDRLNFDNRHTLYSWKHTGVVQAYNAGVDIKSIQRQCRHHSIEMTDQYLISLGLYNNEQFLLKMPEM